MNPANAPRTPAAANGALVMVAPLPFPAFVELLALMVAFSGTAVKFVNALISQDASSTSREAKRGWFVAHILSVVLGVYEGRNVSGSI